MQPKLKTIPWKPGRWIDWSAGRPVIRDAGGRIIATDLQVDEAGIEVIARRMCKDLRLGEAETEDLIRTLKSRPLKADPKN